MREYYQRLINYLENLPEGITIIPIQNDRNFNLEVVRVGNQITGVKVSNLSQPIINIEVFEVAISFIYFSPNRSANRGNNTKGPITQPINTIDAHVAHIAYGIIPGTNALRRITHIAGILIAANVCAYNRPCLNLLD